MIVVQALQGNWMGVYDEVKQMKEACGAAHMKAILGVGELGTMENVYKASMVCMQAGSDFIKTSTGKESVNATLPSNVTLWPTLSNGVYKQTINFLL